MEYLSEEDFKTAAKNGIDYRNAYNRVYVLGWDVQTAITEPIHSNDKSDWWKYRESCKKVGINQNMFYQRRSRGWSIEKILSTPHSPGNRFVKRPDTILDDKLLAVAAQNGIGANTAKARVHRYKWPIEKAVTEPVNMRFSSRRAK